MVILNKSDYINKTKEILSDKSKFKVISSDWFNHIIALEDHFLFTTQETV